MGSNHRLGALLGFKHNHRYLGESPTGSSNYSAFYMMSGVVTFTTGIFLTIVRLFEPLFKLLVYK
jgi:hypothetical protein